MQPPLLVKATVRAGRAGYAQQVQCHSVACLEDGVHCMNKEGRCIHFLSTATYAVEIYSNNS